MRRNERGFAFTKKLTLVTEVLVVVLVSSCGKDNVPREPVPFGVMWIVEPKTQWAASSNEPVYKVRVSPSLPDSNFNDRLEVGMLMRIGETTIPGNLIAGNGSSMTGKTISLEMGGKISANYTSSVEVLAYAKLDRNGAFLESKETPLRHFEFIPNNNFPTTLNVEYDHQVSFDIFSRTPNGRNVVDRAFGVTNKELDIILNDASLPVESLIVQNPNLWIVPFLEYIDRHRQLDANGQPLSPMYLAAVINSNRLSGLLGQSFFPDSSNAEFIRSSFLFVEEIDRGHLTAFPFEIANWTLVHEFGIQLAKLDIAQDAPELHDSPFCVMNVAAVWDNVYGDANTVDGANNIAGTQLRFFRNPFFCRADVDRLNRATIP